MILENDRAANKFDRLRFRYKDKGKEILADNTIIS